MSPGTNYLAFTKTLPRPVGIVTPVATRQHWSGAREEMKLPFSRTKTAPSQNAPWNCLDMPAGSLSRQNTAMGQVAKKKGRIEHGKT